jgi:hypothetical protein
VESQARATSLSYLSLHLGPPRILSEYAAEGVHRVTFRWACGCAARGPGANELKHEPCATHRFPAAEGPERLLEMLLLEPPPRQAPTGEDQSDR